MRLVLQRVSQASVEVEGETIASIESGLLVLCGVCMGDDSQIAKGMARKLVSLRVFEDEEGRMNRDVRDAGGELLVVSQFTLAASLERGRRPSFSSAMRAAGARPLVDDLCDELKAHGVRVQTGQFGAQMSVRLCNDGPVTFVLESPKPVRTG